MVQIDIPAAFIASQLFLDLGSKVVLKEQEHSSEPKPRVYYRYLARAVFFAGFVIAPAGIYLLAGWPGWEQLYWTARVENVIFEWVNALLPALFVMAIVGAAYLGHCLGYRWLVAGQIRRMRITYLSLLAAVVALVLFNYPAFLLCGTYEQYRGARDTMEYVWNNPHDFTIGWAIIMLYFSIAFIYVIAAIRREVKKLT